MPRIKSAIKRVDVAERNRERNRSWKSSIRTVRNNVEDAAEGPDAAASAEALKEAYSVIDRAVSKGVLHKNTAARRKARLVKFVRKAKGS
ncbi:MAG: 30S ribosomal protein S20 [Candidatus Obscuribacterales bacterium]|nr:30S ribosomal protein S20 [Candidatus Obscuribacterales bacterium]